MAYNVFLEFLSFYEIALTTICYSTDDMYVRNAIFLFYFIYFILFYRYSKATVLQDAWVVT